VAFFLVAFFRVAFFLVVRFLAMYMTSMKSARARLKVGKTGCTYTRADPSQHVLHVSDPQLKTLYTFFCMTPPAAAHVRRAHRPRTPRICSNVTFRVDAA
jgi:hypothetical protein